LVSNAERGADWVKRKREKRVYGGIPQQGAKTISVYDERNARQKPRGQRPHQRGVGITKAKHVGRCADEGGKNESKTTARITKVLTMMHNGKKQQLVATKKK